MFFLICSLIRLTLLAGLSGANVIRADAHSDTIEIELHRQSRICRIDNDPEAVFLVLDEEDADPKEIKLDLSDYTDIHRLFTAIRAILEHP